MPTKINWAEETWNPVTGCSKVSQGCKHCYAERLWQRLSNIPNTVYHDRKFTDIQCHTDRLDIPLQWKKTRKIFVNSMSDTFHEQVPFEFIDQIFSTMNYCNNHIFQILTKRPERMLEYVTGRLGQGSLENIWIGTTAEHQKAADERIPLLMQIPALVRWICIEPMLGPIKLPIDGAALDWVVVGGESGPNARPMHPDWARSIRDQCKAHNIPFLFKQWGGREKSRLLDGVLYDGFPIIEQHNAAKATPPSQP